jgi:hypothetical protein
MCRLTDSNKPLCLTLTWKQQQSQFSYPQRETSSTEFTIVQAEPYHQVSISGLKAEAGTKVLTTLTCNTKPLFLTLKQKQQQKH